MPVNVKLPQSFLAVADATALMKLGYYQHGAGNRYTGGSKSFQEYIQTQNVPLLLFGVTGKRIEELFLKASPQVSLWACALSNGNADFVQAILSLGEEEVIPYPYDHKVVELLKSLPPETQVRLIKATTFKYRGVVNKVSTDILTQISEYWQYLGQPNVRQHLGRIRCWFSLQEGLRKLLDEVAGEIPLSQPKELEDLSNSRWTISIPMTSKELRDRGAELSNCLGVSQVLGINAGEIAILIVCENGRATHALKLDLKSKQVVEFSASRNSAPNPLIEKEVTEALVKAGVVTAN